MSKEQEALGPVAARAGGALPADDDALFAAEPSMAGGDMAAEDRRRERRGADWDADNPYLSQETVELDMRAILDDDASTGAGHGGARSMMSAAPVRALR